MTRDIINFTLTIEEEPNYTLDVDDGEAVDLALDAAYIVRQISGDIYDGDYIITPLANEDQVLPTRAKTMEDDLTVLKVPYFETSNIYGDTVYIASEVD